GIDRQHQRLLRPTFLLKINSVVNVPSALQSVLSLSFESASLIRTDAHHGRSYLSRVPYLVLLTNLQHVLVHAHREFASFPLECLPTHRLAEFEQAQSAAFLFSELRQPH